MAITFGTSQLTNNASSASLSISVNAAGYDMLVVGGGDRTPALAATFNTTETFTALTGVSGTSRAAKHFYLRNPTATTANVTVTFTLGAAGFIVTPLAGTSSTVTAAVTGSSASSSGTATSTLTSTVGDTIMIYSSHGNQGVNTFDTCGNPTGGTIQLQGGTVNQLAAGSFTSTGSDALTMHNTGSSVNATSAFAITPSASTTNSSFLMFM